MLWIIYLRFTQICPVLVGSIQMFNVVLYYECFLKLMKRSPSTAENYSGTKKREMYSVKCLDLSAESVVK